MPTLLGYDGHCRFRRFVTLDEKKFFDMLKENEKTKI
jgi:hypothetical protein